MLQRMKESIKNHKGYSMLELIIAIAIFSMVSVTIGSILVVGTRLYRNGSQETEIQQETQTAVNIISSLVKRAEKAEYVSDVLTLENGDDIYEIRYHAAEQELLYYQYNKTDAAQNSGEQLIAENISGFDANVDDFEAAKTVVLHMTVTKDERDYTSTYTMTARNDVTDGVSSPVIKTASIYTDSYLVMVPGEVRSLNVTVKGSNMGFTARAVDESGNTVTEASLSTDSNHVNIALSSGIDCQNLKVILSTVEVASGSSVPLATWSVDVKVRRVTSLAIEHTFDNPTEAVYGQPGAEFTFYSQATGDNLDKVAGVGWDDHYQNPYAVEWDYEAHIGTDTTDVFEQYFEMTDSVEDGMNGVRNGRPHITFTCRQALPTGFKLTVTATSKHALGYNKGGYDAEGNFTLNYYADVTASDTLTPKAARIVPDTILVMEPNETQKIKVTKSGAVSAVKCEFIEYNSNTLLNESISVKTGGHDAVLESTGTYADYDMDKEEITVSLGKSEYGYAYPSDNIQGIDKFDLNHCLVLHVSPDSGDPNARGVNILIYVRRTTSVEFAPFWTNPMKAMTPEEYAADQIKKNFQCQFVGQAGRTVKGYNIGEMEGHEGTHAFMNPCTGYWTVSMIDSDGNEIIKKMSINNANVSAATAVSEVSVNMTTEMIEDIKSKASYAGDTYYAFDSSGKAIFWLQPGINVKSDYSVEPCMNFKLLENLPGKCSKITITCHATHPDGTYQGEVTNKTGNRYIEDDQNIEYTFVLYSKDGSEDRPEESVLDPADFFRGSPYFFEEHGYTGINGDDKKNTFAQNKGADFHYYFRFRETGGTWSQYYRTAEGGSTWKLNENETLLFHPDKEYELEFIGAVINFSTKTIYWPVNDYLTSQSGVTTGFEDFSIYTTDTSVRTGMSEFCHVFKMGRAGVNFKENAELSISAGAKNVGSAKEPLVIPGDKNIKSFTIAMNGEYLNFGSQAGNTVFKDKLDIEAAQLQSDGSWVSLAMNLSPITLGQHDNATFHLSLDDNKKEAGIYRYGIVVKTNLFRDLTDTTVVSPSETIESHTSSAGEKTYDLSYDDQGYIFIKVE